MKASLKLLLTAAPFVAGSSPYDTLKDLTNNDVALDLTSYDSCALNDVDNDCQLSSLNTNTSTLVSPDPNSFGTGCINGGDYHFQVFPSPSLADPSTKNNILV